MFRQRHEIRGKLYRKWTEFRFPGRPHGVLTRLVSLAEHSLCTGNRFFLPLGQMSSRVSASRGKRDANSYLWQSHRLE